MLHQNLLQKQQGRILPQQIQLLNLFHLNSLELEHRLQQELEDNPLLEENTADQETESEKYNKEKVQDYQDWEEYGYDDIPDYTTEYAGYLSSEDLPQRPLTETFCFRTELKEQFRLLEVTEKEIIMAFFTSGRLLCMRCNCTSKHSCMLRVAMPAGSSSCTCFTTFSRSSVSIQQFWRNEMSSAIFSSSCSSKPLSLNESIR